MGSERPLPDRCSARLRGKRKGEFCTLYPVRDKTRCRMHGGGTSKKTGRSSGAPIKHGRYSERFRKLAPAMRDRLEHNLSDPELLDMRRPVAVLSSMLEEHATFPDEDTLKSLATTDVMRELGIEPTAADVERLRVQYLQMMQKLVVDTQVAQQRVVREQGVRDTLQRSVPVLIGRFFDRFQQLITRLVVEQELQHRLLEGIRNEARLAIVESMQTGEELARAS